MKKYIWISLVILISCGGRKSKVDKQSEKLDTKTEQIAETKAETTSEKTGETSYNLNSDFLNFNIEPVNDMPAIFKFIYGGQEIRGETTGKLNFSNEKRQEDIKTRFREIIHTTYVTETNYQTHTTYKKATKSKETERKDYPWYWIVVGTILLWELLKIGIKKFLPVLNVGNILERLNKLR